MSYDSGRIAWLRGLRSRRPRNQIDPRDPIDERFSALAVEAEVVTLRELPNYMTETDRAYVLLAELTPLGREALDENP